VVTGVLGWPNALVADPAFDVASTLSAAEIRRSIGGAPSGLDASPYAARLLAHARRVTGVVASL
jgi:hypothetical protein